MPIIVEDVKKARLEEAKVPGSRITRYGSVWVVWRPDEKRTKTAIQKALQPVDVTESYQEQKEYAKRGWKLVSTKAGTFAIPPKLTPESERKVKKVLEELPSREAFTGVLVEITYPDGTKSYRRFETKEEAQEWIEKQQRLQKIKASIQEAKRLHEETAMRLEQPIKKVPRT